MAYDKKTDRALSFLEDAIAACRYLEAYFDLKAEGGEKVAVKCGEIIRDLHADAKTIREVYFEQGRLFDKPKGKGKNAS